MVRKVKIVDTLKHPSQSFCLFFLKGTERENSVVSHFEISILFVIGEAGVNSPITANIGS